MTVPKSRRAALVILASTVSTFGVGGQACYGGGHQHGPVYRTLDTLAGGIESAICVAQGVTSRLRGGSSQVCDDGCDAMTGQELESMPPITDHRPHLAAPMSPPSSGYLPAPSDSMPIESMPQYQTPLPQSQPIGPRATESRGMSPSLPSSQAPRLPQPIPDSQPNSRPSAPVVPKNGQPGNPPQSNDDDWMEGFSDESSQPTSRPRIQRAPAETIKSLPDPFKDDPQSKNRARSLNAPASYWETW